MQRETSSCSRLAGITACAIAVTIGFTTVNTALAQGTSDTNTETAAVAGPPIPLPKPDPNAEPVAEKPVQAAPVPSTVTPYAPAVRPETGTPSDENEGTVYLVSRLTGEGKQVDRGMTWRVYTEALNDDGRLTLIANAAGGDAEFRLKPGTYLVHAGFGYAGSTARITVGSRLVHTETIVLNAGGLKLGAELAENRPLDQNRVTFDVYANDEGSSASQNSRRLVVSKVKPGTMIRLNAGSYYVVSHYGGVNAEVRADIRVQPGKLTEATVYHKAAHVTLKLVNEPGGEALANTHWSVLTPGGDQLVESVGAFPSFVLAEGDYAVVAKHNDEVFNRDFSVESGLDRDVEVVVTSR